MLAPNGNIVFIPENAGVVGVFDPVASTLTLVSFPGLAASAAGKYSGGVLTPGGRVVFVPANADAVGVFTPGRDAPAYTVEGGVPQATLHPALADHTPSTLHPYTLYPTPYTLYPVPCTL